MGIITMSLPPTDPAKHLASYVSRLQLQRIAALGGPRTSAGHHEHRGAILFIDISGFTALTEKLSLDGPRGAEALSEILNVVFGSMISITHAHGGDTLVFAGDALTVSFEAGKGDAELKRAVCLAAQSALALQASLNGMEPRPGMPIRLRLAIGAGRFFSYEVGGFNQRWAQILAGPAMSQAYRADKLGAPGRIILSPEAWALTATHLSGEPMEGGAHRLKAVTLPMPPSASPEPGIDPALAPVLATYVAPVVVERLAVGHSHYLAEFRVVSMMFVNLPRLALQDASGLEELQRAMEVIQAQVDRFGGMPYQMLSDEKGTSFLAGFGMPPRALGDDAAHASEAALAIEQALRTRGFKVAVSVATGRLFFGAYGPPNRRNYALIGPTINRSARLMQSLLPEGGVLCDDTTRLAAERTVEFKTCPPISVKGVAEPLPVFLPLRRRPSAPYRQVMLGRTREVQLLTERLRELRELGLGGTLAIEAEAGMGKSILFTHFQEVAAQAGVQLWMGAGDPIESRTAYYPFRPVVRALFEAREEDSPEQVRGKVLRKLEELPDQRELAPLLNAVLPLELPENALSQQMAGQIRSENLNQLLCQLIQRAAQRAPLVLGLEDVHWMDSASWALCALCTQLSHPVLLVLTTRPMDSRPPEWSRVVEGPNGGHIVLESLNPEDTIELVKRRLRVTTMPVALKDFIVKKSEGNPFFSEELALSLRDGGVISVVNGECVIRTGAGELFELTLPNTVQALLTSRIDRLPPSSQLSLKVASVVGRAFQTSVVQSIHPMEAERSRLAEHMEVLTQAALVQPERPREDYTFRHALTHETAYATLPYAQRKPLHQAAAEYIEKVYAQELSPYYSRLSFHWTQAEVPEKAIHYLSEAGTQALDAYANQAAVDFFSQAITLDEKQRGPLAVDPQRARWYRMMAEASYSLIQFDKARDYYETTIRLCGFPMPRFGPSSALEVVRHIYRRYVPNTQVPAPELRERCIEALRAADNLGVIHLWQGNTKGLVHITFEAANIAALAGPSAESARARSMLAYLLVMSGMREVAVRDLQAAVEMAEQSGQLLQRVSTNIFMGMAYALLGRCEEALPYLRTADTLAGKLGAGLWKHRGKFMLAEPLMLLGELDTASELFGACAALSAGAEPPVTGFANSMKALCWLRKGRIQEALALMEGPAGLQLVRDNPTALQLCVSLGAQLEAHLENATPQKALALAEEALRLASTGNDCNSYLNGHYGQAAVATYYLALWEQAQAGAPMAGAPGEKELVRLARQACANLKKCQKIFPAVEPRYLLLQGLFEQLSGHPRKAQALWLRAAERARGMKFPHEQGLALYHLGRFSTGAERQRALEEACQLFARYGLALDEMRARSALASHGTVLPFPASSAQPRPPTAQAS